jgi:hypothetical protein
MAKKPTPKKKATLVKAKSKTTAKPAAKKSTAKKIVKPAVKKAIPTRGQAIPKKIVKKVSKPVSKKPVVKVKPAVKKIVPEKAVKKLVKQVAKKPLVKTKPVAKKPAPKKVVPAKVKAVVKTPPVKTKVVAVKKKAQAPAKKKIEKKVRTVPIKMPSVTESNYNRADMFYKNVLHAEIIKRYSVKKEEDKEMLGKDISLHMKMNEKETTISEKNRDQDWNDIYVEIYKKYPDEAGWIKFTEAEYLAYFFPGRVFLCRMEPIRNLCQDILCRAVNTGIFKDMYYMFFRSSGRHSQSIKINNKTYSFTFHQTYHDAGENSYYSIGLILPFVMLMDFRIDYKIFKQ